MPPVVIAARGVNHAFGTGQARAQVLFGVDLEVRRGEFVALKGASGSGKTGLVVTHDPRVIARADRVVTLDGGRIAGPL